MHESAENLRDSLRGKLVAAAATPMTAAGEVDLELVESYFRSLVADGADGLAVAVHTGRGPFLAPDVRAGVIARAVRVGVPVIVGVGGTPGTPGPAEARAAADAGAPAEARAAAEAGATGVLVFPAEGDRVAAHEAIWQASALPMIAFDLYTRPCPPATLRELVSHPGVVGLKTALLSDAMGCQESIALTRAADRLAITGEDRMFGPSLLWGAEAALVGIAAASVSTTADVLKAFAANDLRAFEEASSRLDRLAQHTFIEPMEGYVQRMLWLAAAEGRIPETHAHDLHAPPLDEPHERATLATHVP